MPLQPSPHFDRAIAFIDGEKVPQDLAAARRELESAAEAGDIRAVHYLSGFMAGGIGGGRDWPAAVALLRSWAPRDGLAAAQAMLISAMQLTPDGFPISTPPLKRLHPTKSIFVAEKLMSPQECDLLIQMVDSRLQPAKVITGQAEIQSQSNVRDNDHGGFAMLEELPFIRAINLRIAAATGTDVRQGEPLQVMRYREGQQYRTHLDRISEGTNQRLMTAIVYLNHGYSGGQTAFPALNLSMRGEIGDMLTFRNLTEDCAVDREMRHAGLPPTSGVKYIASRWILQRPAYDEQGKLLGKTLWA